MLLFTITVLLLNQGITKSCCNKWTLEKLVFFLVVLVIRIISYGLPTIAILPLCFKIKMSCFKSISLLLNSFLHHFPKVIRYCSSKIFCWQLTFEWQIPKTKPKINWKLFYSVRTYVRYRKLRPYKMLLCWPGIKALHKINMLYWPSINMNSK